MLTFVRNENGRPEAQEGSHDDLIMSLAIAYYSRGQQSMKVKESPVAEQIINFEVEKPNSEYLDYGTDVKVI